MDWLDLLGCSWVVLGLYLAHLMNKHNAKFLEHRPKYKRVCVMFLEDFYFNGVLLYRVGELTFVDRIAPDGFYRYKIGLVDSVSLGDKYNVGDSFLIHESKVVLYE